VEWRLCKSLAWAAATKPCKALGSSAKGKGGRSDIDKKDLDNLWHKKGWYAKPDLMIIGNVLASLRTMLGSTGVTTILTSGEKCSSR
jgi:hypothetical protein